MNVRSGENKDEREIHFAWHNIWSISKTQTNTVNRVLYENCDLSVVTIANSIATYMQSLQILPILQIQFLLTKDVDIMIGQVAVV